MTLIAPTLQGFFTDRLTTQRQASPRTIAAYRDTLRLLLGFVHRQTGMTPSQLDWDNLDATVISAFLTHLENERRNSIRTRNVRLTAIPSLFSYAALRHSRARPAHPARPGHPPEAVRQADDRLLCSKSSSALLRPLPTVL
jgi:site-specific recombinase XerD